MSLKISNNATELLMERWASTSEMNTALTQMTELSQGTLALLQTEANHLSEGCSDLSQRLNVLETRHHKENSSEDICKALTAAIQQQEDLVGQLENELLSLEKSNDELAAYIKKSHPVLEPDIDDLFTETCCLSEANQSLTAQVEKIDSCQKEINELEAERQKIDNKVVALRGRYNQHSHSSSYTYGNYSGSAGPSSGPTS